MLHAYIYIVVVKTLGLMRECIKCLIWNSLSSYNILSSLPKSTEMTQTTVYADLVCD